MEIFALIAAFLGFAAASGNKPGALSASSRTTGSRGAKAGGPPASSTIRQGGAVSVEDVVNAWAAIHNIDPRRPLAVVRVESGTLPLVDAAGRPLPRLEVHHLFARLRERGVAEGKIAADLRKHFWHPPSSGKGTPPPGIKPRAGAKPWHDQAWRPTSSSAWRRLHNGRISEQHKAIELARRLSRRVSGSEEPALLASSWGLGQILGRHHKALGYPTAAAMVNDASTVPGQVRQFLRFLQTDKDGQLLAALKRGDVFTFARLYNGDGPVYSRKLIKQGWPSGGSLLS